MEHEGIVDEFAVIFPNAGILPFNDLESASELNEVYRDDRVLPCDIFKDGNYFAAAIKRRRGAEIKASRRIALDISCALDLPIELLLEIFELLHPIDLYSIMCSTKRLRSILLDRSALSVWEEAFKRCSDVLPPCPMDISKPRWASMLFGPATCDYCGRKGAMIDFHFRRRFCRSCMNDMYIKKSSIDVNSLGIGEDVETFWKCIPPSYRRGAQFYPNVWNYDVEPRYLTWDISKMIARFNFFKSRISSSIPGASLEFEEFKILEIANANRGLEESKRSNGIMVQMGFQVSQEYVDNLTRLIKRHASVLLRRGHDQVDLNMAFGKLLDHYLYTERFKFNYRSCKQLALELLRTCEACKIDRLAEMARVE